MQKAIKFILVLLVIILSTYVSNAENLEVPEKYPSIQAAIDVAKDGDEVIVSRGRYYENISFKGKAITVRSTDPNDQVIVAATILHGEETNAVVTFDNGETANAVLFGMTITQSSGRRNDDKEDDFKIDIRPITDVPGIVGGGVYIKNSSPTIKANIISNNTVIRNGGGIYICESSSGIIEGNIISDNRAYGHGGGICVVTNSSPTIINNTLSGNASYLGSGIYVGSNSTAKIMDNTFTYNGGHYGGGMYIEDSSPVISNNRIMSNNVLQDGGGLYLHRSSPLISENTISDNTTNGMWGGGGIVIWQECSPTVTGNIITGNTVLGIASIWGGGGLCIWNKCDPIIKDNYISGNITKRDGGAICLHSKANPVIENNIFYNNKTSDRGGAIYVFHDCIVLDKNNKEWPRKNDITNNNKYSENYPDDIFFDNEVLISNVREQ